MCRNMNKAVLIITACCLLAGRSLAATTLVDDFDSYATGQVDAVTTNWKEFLGDPGQGAPTELMLVNIAVDPGDPKNKVLDFLEGVGSPGGYGIFSGAAIIANGETKTLFFRCRQSGLANSCVGMTDVNDPIANSWGVQSNQIRLNLDAVQAINEPATPTWDPVPGKTMTANTWYNIWVVTDHATQTYEIYMNSTPGAGANPATDRVGNLATNPFRADNTFDLDRFSFISWGTAHVYFDDIYVSDGEDLTAVRGKRASAPNPADVSIYDGINVTLAWAPGLYAAQHDVYFGNNFNDVNNAKSSDPMGPAYVYKARQSVDANSYPVSGLIPGTTYYWRIDEVNDACEPYLWEGSIWRFTVNPLTAYNPSPPDGDAIVDPNVNLSWSAGVSAADVNGHKVYVDLSEANVIARSGCDVNGVIRTDPNYIFGPPLTLGDTYYWAIDEVNDANTWPGPVWSFTTWPYIPIDDPNLLGWWKFEDSGVSKTLDSSGHNRHGTLYGGPAYATGVFDEAINLDGTDDWVSVGSVGISGAAPRTIAGWVKMNTTTIPPWTNVFGFTTDSTTFYTSFDIVVSGADAPPIPAGWYIIHTYYWQQPITGPDLEWHHFAATYDGNSAYDGNSVISWYGDGEFIGEEFYGIDTIDNVLMGKSASNNNYFPGLIDDVRIYDKVLTLGEIRQIMFPPQAWLPNPANYDTEVANNPTLTWNPGKYADSVAGHRVYFDPDEQKVIDRSGCEVNGVSTTNPFYTPSPLDLETTYYWAIDEVNDACEPYLWEGGLWRFTVADYRLVEDFELYVTDSNLWDVWHWLDTGTMSQLSLADTIARGGDSMLYEYFNADWPYYSEGLADIADLPNPIGSDWTASDVKVLMLYFYGDAGNPTNEQMYVALTGGGKTGVVLYDGDMNDVKKEEWQQWNIVLQDFVDDNDVDLTNVSRITIGFGDKVGPGIYGKVYFDDIRLYPPRCAPWLRRAAGDIDNDCDVDYNDLEIVTNNWLISDYNVTPVNPTDSNLVGWWKLDEISGTVAADSSVNDNDGIVYGDPNWGTAGQIGTAMDFNGVNDYVDCGNDVSLDINDAITLAVWVKTNDCGNSEYNPYIAKGDNAYTLQHRNINDLEIAIYDAGAWHFANTLVDSSFNGVWHHLAGTYNGSQIKFYVDGELNATTDYVGSIASETANVNLGRSSDFTDRLYEGLLDDVRIYSRALSQDEVAYLAERSTFTQPLYLLLTPPNPNISLLYDDGIIDFKDYAVLADEWLEEQIWP